MSRIVLPPAVPPGPEWWPPRPRLFRAATVRPTDFLTGWTAYLGVFTLTVVLLILGYDLAAIVTFVGAISAAATTAYLQVATGSPRRTTS